MKINWFDAVTTSPTNISINDGLWCMVGYTQSWGMDKIVVDVTFKKADGTVKRKFSKETTVYCYTRPSPKQKNIVLFMVDPVTVKVAGLDAGDLVTAKCGQFAREYTVIQIISRL